MARFGGSTLKRPVLNNEMEGVLQYISDKNPEQREYIGEHFHRLLSDTYWIENHCKPTDAILDIGSFPWMTPAYLSLRGFKNIHTIDIARKDLFPKSKSWNFRSSTLNIEAKPLPVKSGSVDVVVLFEIFEHLYHRPNFVLREFKRVMKKGARLILSTPNGASFHSLSKVLFKRRMGQPVYDTSDVYEKVGHFSHIREYSYQELREYLARFGLSIEYHRFRTYPGEDGWLPWSNETFMGAILPSLRRHIFLVARAND